MSNADNATKQSKPPKLPGWQAVEGDTIKGWTEMVYATAKDNGFHSGKPAIAKHLINIHGEVSEAWEEFRKPDFDPKLTYYRSDGKPEGLPSELADIVIRAFDTAKTFGIDIEAAMIEKHNYNRTREFRHGGKRA